MLADKKCLMIFYKNNKYLLVKDNLVIWEKDYNLENNLNVSDTLITYLCFLNDLHNLGLFPNLQSQDF